METQASIRRQNSEPLSCARTSLEMKLGLGIFMVALGSLAYLYLRHVTSSGCYRNENNQCVKWRYDSFGRYTERIVSPCPPGC
jgi:hypothetical protein